MEKIRVLIADDEPLARKRLVKLLQAEPDADLVGECGNGVEAVEAIRELKPDLVLLDMQMPEMGGLDVLEKIGPSALPAVIFVTAYDQYALKAFDVHALDYLLKPFDDERFERALQRARQQIRRGRFDDLSEQLMGLLRDLRGEGAAPEAAARPASSSRMVERLAIKTSGRVFFLKVEEIDWIEGAGVYVHLHVGNKSHLLRETMSNLEEKLDPNRFIRIHRSTIVNVERIKELRPYFHGEYVVVLHDGKQLKLSRSHREKLHALLGQST